MDTTTVTSLVTPTGALELQNSGQAVIIDVRDGDDYAKEHVAGAISIPQIFYHLSTTSDAELKQSAEVFEELFCRAGVTPDTLVILYEDGLASRFGGSFRGWWWLNYFGHEKVTVLDGGYKAWKSAGLPVNSDPVVRQRSDFNVSINNSVLARKQDVLDAIVSSDTILLDNRDAVEWYGESSSPYDTPDKDFSPRRGRIPGATWVEWTKLMDDSDSPTFRSPEDIRAVMADAGVTPDDDIIIYCFKGSRASNTFAALKLAGFKRLRNYLGSWYEWAAEETLPIEVGTR